MNGCGPGWIPDFWRDYYFHDECNIHDQDYLMGVPQSEADRMFYEGMKQKIAQEDSFWVRKKRAVQAWTFFHLVRNFGHFFHKSS